MQFVEKREFFRLNVEIPAHINFFSNDNENGIKSFSTTALIRDLSGNGLKLETNTFLKEKNKLSVRFSLPLNERKKIVHDFFLTAQVRRKKNIERKNFYEYGVKFLDIIPSLQDKIIKFLFDLQISSRYHVRNALKSVE